MNLVLRSVGSSRSFTGWPPLCELALGGKHSSRSLYSRYHPLHVPGTACPCVDSSFLFRNSPKNHSNDPLVTMSVRELTVHYHFLPLTASLSHHSVPFTSRSDWLWATVRSTNRVTTVYTATTASARSEMLPCTAKPNDWHQNVQNPPGDRRTRRRKVTVSPITTFPPH